MICGVTHVFTSWRDCPLILVSHDHPYLHTQIHPIHNHTLVQPIRQRKKILVHLCWFFDQFSDYFSIIIHNYIYNIYTNTKTCVLWIQKKKISFDFSFCVPLLFRNLGQRFAERKVLKKKKRHQDTHPHREGSVFMLFLYTYNAKLEELC